MVLITPRKIMTKELGYFIIKYIERFELNGNVGGEPQVWFIPDAGKLHELSRDLCNKFNENTDKRLDKHANDLSNLGFYLSSYRKIIFRCRKKCKL